MRNSIFFVILFMISACSGERWTAAERKMINDKSAVMRVLTVENPSDSTLLRDTCRNFTCSMLRSDLYNTLASKMTATVTSCSEDAVGIAGPQVGISRRVVAVQRFDKAGEPFEVYPNIRIIAMRGEKVEGPEGCLSVPDCEGNVLRSRDIDICYTSVSTLSDTVETVMGFTAVIFQHECDHLDGVLFTDRLNAVD